MVLCFLRLLYRMKTVMAITITTITKTQPRMASTTATTTVELDPGFSGSLPVNIEGTHDIVVISYYAKHIVKTYLAQQH